MDNFDFPNLTGHGISIMAILIAWTGVLSPIMAGLATTAAFIYYLVSIYSSKAVQQYIHSRRLRKLARLKKEQARIEAALLVQRQQKD